MGLCYENLGMNYGQHYQSGLDFNETNTRADLQKIWDMGIRKIRTGGNGLGKKYPFNNDTNDPSGFYREIFATSLSIAAVARDMGFYVCFVYANPQLSNSDWTDASNNLNLVADILWNSGSPLVDELQIGNEQELNTNGGALTLVQDKIRAQSVDVKTNHFMSDGVTTFISYALPQGYASFWLSGGKGSLDRITYNVYATSTGDFEAEITQFINVFGLAGFEVTEWSVNSTWPFSARGNINTCQTEDQECVQIWKRLQVFKKYKVVAYFFVWRWDQYNDQFGLYNSVTKKFRKWYYVLCGRPPLKYTNLRRSNRTDHGNALITTPTTVRCRRAGAVNLAWQTPAWSFAVLLKPAAFTFGNVYREEDSTGVTGSFNVQTTGDTLLFPGSSALDLHLNLNQWNLATYSVGEDGSVDVKINNAVGTRNFDFTPGAHPVMASDRAAIGIDITGNFNTYNGQIGGVAFYPFKLTDEDHRAMYEDLNLDLPNQSRTFLATMSEGSGTTVHDTSGNGKDFTLNSATGAWATRPAEITATRPAVSRPALSTHRSLLIPLPSERFEFSTKWSGLAMNYGQDTQSGAYDTATITRDLENMWNLGIRFLRIASSTYDYAPGIASSKQLALQAMARGFQVEWGIGISGATDANWDAFVAAIPAAAAWAWANGVTRFGIGNEIEYRETGGYLTNSVGKIKAVATIAKLSFPSDGVTRFITYAMAQSALEYVGAPGGWIEQGKGDIQSLGYNVYSDGNLTAEQAYTQFTTRITDLYNVFGKSLSITEWNMQPDIFTNEVDQAAEILRRLNFLINSGIQLAFFFAYRWDSSGTEHKWALIRSSTYKLWFNSLFV